MKKGRMQKQSHKNKSPEKDASKLEKAKMTAWRFSRRRDYESIMKAYELIRNFSNIEDINLRKLLENNAKQGIKLSEKRIRDYSLIGLETGAECTGYVGYWDLKLAKDKLYRIYLDAPVGFVLTYKNLPQAAVSFAPKGIEDLIIPQLQGVNSFGRHARGLMPLNWKSLLIDTVAAYGSSQGFSGLIIQSGHNNEWTKKVYRAGPKTGKAHLQLEKALKIYDEFAESNGFKQQEDKNWYKEI